MMTIISRLNRLRLRAVKGGSWGSSSTTLCSPKVIWSGSEVVRNDPRSDEGFLSSKLSVSAGGLVSIDDPAERSNEQNPSRGQSLNNKNPPSRKSMIPRTYTAKNLVYPFYRRLRLRLAPRAPKKTIPANMCCQECMMVTSLPALSKVTIMASFKSNNESQPKTMPMWGRHRLEAILVLRLGSASAWKN
jgi:hypothetical protein